MTKTTLCRIRVWAIFFIAAGCLGSANDTRADLIVYEGFDYEADTLLGDNGYDGGFGWFDEWTKVNPAADHLVSEEGLTYTDSKGNELVTTGLANRLVPAGSAKNNRVFDPALSDVDESFYEENEDGFNMLGVDGTTIWMSVLGLSETGGSVFIQLRENPQSVDAIKPRTANLFVQDGSWAFGDIDNTVDQIHGFTFEESDAFADELAFIVARIDYGDDNEEIANVWINPDLGSEPSPGSAAIRNFPMPTGMTFNDVSIGANADGLYDEFRLGTTYADVAPIVGGNGPVCDPNTQGDIDGNGKVEFADFLILSANFGSEVDGHESGDLDCNGSVEFADFLILSANFGESVAEAAAVPEPASLGLLGFSVLFLGCLRRCRNG